MGRQLYDVRIKLEHRDDREVTTHLDLEQDEAKMRELLFDAARQDRNKPEDIGAYSMEIREHGDRRLIMTYVTTANS